MTGLAPRRRAVPDPIWVRPQALPAAGHLVVTVGGSPVPVLLALLARRPAQVSAIVSPESARVWQRAWVAYGLLEQAAQGVNPLVLEVGAWDTRDLGRAVGIAVGRSAGEWELAYSGGSPAFSAAAFRGWWAAVGAPAQRGATGGSAAGRFGLAPGGGAAEPGPTVARAWYAAEQGDALIAHDGTAMETDDVLAGRTLGLRGLIELHGLVARGFEKYPEAWEPHAVDLRPGLVRRHLHELPVRAEASQRVELTERADRATLDALALIAAGRGVSVYPRARASTVSPDGPDVAVDLPLSAVRGLSLRAIEVASYVRRARPGGDTIERRIRMSDLKESLFDAERTAHRAGGMHARCALISLEPMEVNRAPTVEALWGDLGPLAVPDRLGREGEPGEPDLPPTTTFALKELLRAVTEHERGIPLAECEDLARWMCGAP